jgi:hypothetical protein
MLLPTRGDKLLKRKTKQENATGKPAKIKYLN